MRPISTPKAAAWTQTVLYVAAAYNLLWGTWVILDPEALFRWAQMEPPRYPQLWQCVGMVVGVYGVGYWIAARDPLRHWPIVLVGLLGKILGPIGFLQAAIAGEWPWRWGATILANDLVWWVPFSWMLYLAFRQHSDTSQGVEAPSYDQAIRERRSHRNASLLDISHEKPTIVVFLRHAGCTFCREALSDLGQLRSRLEPTGNIAVVHMSEPMGGTLMLQRNGLEGVHQFSDPHCELYRAFRIERGELHNVISWKVLARGLWVIAQGHGLGPLAGDGFRMPAAFVLRNGEIIAEFRPESAADRPDYLAFFENATRKCCQVEYASAASETAVMASK